MYARSATIHADPQRVDDGIAFVRDELMPAATRLDECVGLSMLCDRESGRCIVTTSWRSEAAMTASTGTAHDLVRRAAGPLGGGDIRVDEWEIVVMHRARTGGDGCCARITWTRCDPADLPAVLEDLPLTLLPRLDHAEGFCSISLFVDRATGSCSATAVYDDRQSMESSRDQVVALRAQMAEQMLMEVTEVAEFELAIHHLRVPEVH